MKRHYLIALGSWLIIGNIALGNNLDAGWEAYNAGEYDKAYDLFAAAFRANPAGIEENLALADAAVKRRKFSHAVFAYDRVLMTQPENEKALQGKAAALMALGQQEEAREAYRALLETTTDPAVRTSAQDSIKQIDKGLRELVLRGRVYLSGIYDDNVNYASDDLAAFPPSESQDTAGLEGGVDLHAEYDVGRRNGWLLVGGLGLFDSWYEDAEEQEVSNARVYGGLRKVGKRNLVEVVGRGEYFWFGGDPLVNIYGGDGAWMFAANKNHYLITRATLESRDYDADADPFGTRDSVYAQVGEEWKYFFSNRNNNLALGVDLLSEEAESGENSYLGYRLRVDGQVELPGGVIAYADGRYRFAKYDDLSFFQAVEREDDRWDLLVGVKRRFTERTWLDLNYLRIWNASNDPVFEFDRNRVSLTAIYEF